MRQHNIWASTFQVLKFLGVTSCPLKGRVLFQLLTKVLGAREHVWNVVAKEVTETQEPLNASGI